LDNKTWVVYLLKCANNSLYCGITNDMVRRLRQHNGEIQGGAKYTRANSPNTRLKKWIKIPNYY